MHSDSSKELEEISQLLNKNKLTPDADLEKAFSSSSKSLVISCHDKEGRALVIKILLSGDTAWRRKFFNELRFHKTLAGGAPSFIPEVVEIQPEDPLPFLLFEKIDGNPLSPNRIPSRARPELTSKIANLLEQIQNIPLEDFDLPHYRGDFLIQKVLKYQENPPVPRPIFKEVLSRLKESREELNDACEVLVHGDFMFQNIIESGNQLIAIDWEFVEIGNRAWDAATLWLTTFKLGDWRKKFFKEVKSFKNLFVLNLLRLYLREIRMWEKVTKKYEAVLVRKTCEKELHLALKGFDALLEGVKYLS